MNNLKNTNNSENINNDEGDSLEIKKIPNKNNISNDEDQIILVKIEDFKTLKKKNNETKEHFLFRAKIFLRVYEDTKDEGLALKYSNIWINILSLNCSYQKDVMELVQKYRPSDKENIYFDYTE